MTIKSTKKLVIYRLTTFDESGAPPEPVDSSDDAHACDYVRQKDEEEEELLEDEDKGESSTTTSTNEIITEVKTTEHRESTSGPSPRAS